MLFAVTLIAQGPPPGPPGEKKGHPAPKNLKILNPGQVGPAMRAFKTALGVECTFCHVQGDFASDENHHKTVARKMLTLTHEVNAANFDGKMRVTCYTCHRGAQEPPADPPAAGQ